MKLNLKPPPSYACDFCLEDSLKCCIVSKHEYDGQPGALVLICRDCVLTANRLFLSVKNATGGLMKATDKTDRLEEAKEKGNHEVLAAETHFADQPLENDLSHLYNPIKL
jgi:hypothetical protein